MSSLERIRTSLQSGKELLEALHDLNTLLETNPSSTFASEVASFLPLSQLFSILSLSAGDSQVVHRTCAVLDKVLSVLPVSDVASYGQWIELGLQTSEEAVKKTCLSVLTKHSSDPSVHALLVAPTMFHLITQVVGDESLQCAKMASNLLLQFLTAPFSLAESIRNALVLDLESQAKKSDIVRYRVYELAVEATLQGGGQSFEFISSTGFLQQLVDELAGDDILVKLNCIELLIQLLDSKEGAGFLESRQVLDKLHCLLISAEQDPFGEVVVPGLLKFFGHVCLTRDTDVAVICEKFPEFLRLVLHSVPSPSNTSVWGTAVDTFGVLGSTDSGRKALFNVEAETKSALNSLGEFIVSGHPDVRTRSLRALSMLLSCVEGCGNWEDSVSLQWFNMIHKDPFPILMSIVRQPFQDLRVAGLRVLLTMASFEWGQRIFSSHAGFLEYLLDRKTEPDKEGRELKYEIVHGIVTTGETAGRVFGNVDLLRLRKYDREGPFFSAADTTVAMEGM